MSIILTDAAGNERLKPLLYCPTCRKRVEVVQDTIAGPRCGMFREVDGVQVQCKDEPADLTSIDALVMCFDEELNELGQRWQKAGALEVTGDPKKDQMHKQAAFSIMLAAYISTMTRAKVFEKIVRGQFHGQDGRNTFRQIERSIDPRANEQFTKLHGIKAVPGAPAADADEDDGGPNAA